MGCPPLAACLWVLCRLLSHFPWTEGSHFATCGPHFCSTDSCCLGQGKVRGQAPMACGCPPSMIPILQNSSIISCEALEPSPESSCHIPALKEAAGRTCNESEAACKHLRSIQQRVHNTCASPTKENVQETLQILQAEAVENHNPTTTKLLLETTEALVLQAALGTPDAECQNFSTSTMKATVRVVRGNCSQTRVVLKEGVDSLSINCHEVVSSGQPGKRAVAFIVYEKIKELLNNATELQGERLNSKVVGGTMVKAGDAFNVTVNITLWHHMAPQAGEKLSCVTLQMTDTKSRWTPEGCERVGGDALHSICACTHFSTFAILMATHPVPDSFALMVVTYVGMSVSLVCLFLAILTFILCRSLWSVSVTLHLQLSICLFVANLFFLVAVHFTNNRLVCAITAGFLHYLFLACFAWMFLEGLHLFLTVRNLRVLNYTTASHFRKRYIYSVGYGTPAIVVAISAAVHPGGYGTKNYCWLSMERGFIWSFLSPVCVVILVNLLFFLTTLWTLRNKLSSLNADVTVLKSTRLMTFKALAHICILGCTWGLGLLQRQGDNTVVAFLFTIINSMQGAFIFLVHCILNRQVMEQYRCWFRALRRQAQPQEMPTTEINITYVTEGETAHSRSTEGCTWEK